MAEPIAAPPPPPADDKVPALKAKGNDLLKSGDLAGAVGAYREAIAACVAAHPELAALHSNLSHALLKQGEDKESLAEAEACISAKPEWHKAHYRKGDALFALHRFEDALAAYQNALVLAPKDAEITGAAKLTEEAVKGGIWIRQLLPGRDIAISSSSPEEALIFGAAKQMKNFIYLVGDASSRECYVVDPCWDPRGIVAFAASQKMKVVGAFPTHYHFDHAGGAIPPPFVAMVYGPMSKPGARLPGLREMGRDHGAALYCHALERERLAKQCDVGLDELHPLEQGSTLLLGTAGHLEVLHTPGHSSGSVCVRVNTGSPGSDGTRTLSVFTGDTVFPGSCGRLDLPDSDKGAMYDSLQKLRTLADDIQVYPGHAYSGDKSTIGQEKVRGLLRPFSKAEWLSMHG